MGFETEKKSTDTLKKSPISNDFFSQNETENFNKMKNADDENGEDDLGFGLYVPSATRSRSSSATRTRSVKFEDDMKSTPMASNTVSKDNGALSRPASNKASYDWLGISTDSDNGIIPKENETDDPNYSVKINESNKQINLNDSNKPKKMQTNQKAEDWLGLMDSSGSSSLDVEYKLSEKKEEPLRKLNQDSQPNDKKPTSDLIKSSSPLNSHAAAGNTNKPAFQQPFKASETTPDPNNNWINELFANKKTNVVEKDKKSLQPLVC
jgi:hypothetical protein